MRTTPNFQPGDIVLIKEDTTTPLQWPLSVIQDIHPGKDGIVQAVTVKTPKGVYKRPTSKICPLPCVNDMYVHLLVGWQYVHT
jgi:hypothetical protein